MCRFKSGSGYHFYNVLSNIALYEAAVAQLVEHHVANVNVTSSSLVSRSNFKILLLSHVEMTGIILNRNTMPGWWNW